VGDTVGVNRRPSNPAGARQTGTERSFGGAAAEPLQFDAVRARREGLPAPEALRYRRLCRQGALDGAISG